ncbi:MAG: iron-sulfur cluster assembly scaffold protein [Deltaproteobacteria bacterium]|nr:iron-sulfur cluster assembly scaffold protein [Deltaproteobacteria bacterium]MBW2106130.1 iron-sulfur cluster assembly scaffold protein [Deltaproteobacteria bacterium]
MSEDFDKAMDELQASVIEDARKIYSEKVIERWLNPKYMGEMENPQGYGKVTGTCGDTVQIFLRADNNKIIDARFITDGCATTIAAGCMACELAMGKPLKEAFKITKDIILEGLGGLPEESIHCALLASDTLKAALNDYIQSKNDPWRKLYKKHDGEGKMQGLV